MCVRCVATTHLHNIGILPFGGWIHPTLVRGLGKGMEIGEAWACQNKAEDPFVPKTPGKCILNQENPPQPIPQCDAMWYLAVGSSVPWYYSTNWLNLVLPISAESPWRMTLVDPLFGDGSYTSQSVDPHLCHGSYICHSLKMHELVRKTWKHPFVLKTSGKCVFIIHTFPIMGCFACGFGV